MSEQDEQSPIEVVAAMTANHPMNEARLAEWEALLQDALAHLQDGSVDEAAESTMSAAVCCNPTTL